MQEKSSNAIITTDLNYMIALHFGIARKKCCKSDPNTAGDRAFDACKITDKSH